jgi:hypothetical protein
MEDWQLEFEWLQVRHKVKDLLKKESLPDLNLVLLMIGTQELGFWRKNFTKEEKQDLMHIGVCELLSREGYYEFIGRDTEGWPHYKVIRPFTEKGQNVQELFLKEQAIHYFKEWEKEASG